MVKRTHLFPRERKEIVDNIVEQLKPQLEQYVKEIVNSYAITEQDVAVRVMQTIEAIEPRWFTRLFFKIYPLRKRSEDLPVETDGIAE